MINRSKVQGKRSKVKDLRPQAKASSSGPGTQDSGLQEGFTLLEIMIALAIIAIALVTLLGLGNRSIEINRQTQMITQGTLLAQQRMSEIELAAAKPGFQFSAEEGAFAPPFDTYRWRIAYEDTPIPLLRLITVTVSWGEEGSNEMVDLQSFVFTP